MSHSTESALSTEGQKLVASKVRTVSLLALVLGLAGVAIAFGGSLAFPSWREALPYSWLFAFAYFFTLCVGGLFWTLLHNATNSGWGVAVRRQMENLAGVIPWMLLVFLPIAFFADDLYEWMTIDPLEDSVIYAKSPFLNLPFFYFRVAFYFVVLGGMAQALRHWSTRQDRDGDAWYTIVSRRMSCGFIALFAIAVTFSAIDWLMALDYRWFSTMWGVYVFAGAALASMSLLVLVITFLRKLGYLQGVVTVEHYHIMGKLMHAFVIFWAYIAFSQYFLYWYANITEETMFFLKRNTEQWHSVSLVLFIGKFVLPFLLLLPRAAKRKARYLSAVAGWILLVHLVEIYWIVIPERVTEDSPFNPHLLDLVSVVAIGGLFVFVLLKIVGRHSLYPNRDPRLSESVHLTN